MQLEYAAFAFIFTLAAVINGLGIVRWLAALAEYVRARKDVHIANYRVFILFASFQFLLHVLLWWSLWGIRTVETFNFLDYLYLLAGPVFLFLSTSLLVPDAGAKQIDLDKHFDNVRQPYATTLSLAWLWTTFLWPVFQGVTPPSMPVHITFLVLAIALRFASGLRTQAALGIANWSLLVFFVWRFAMELGGISGQL